MSALDLPLISALREHSLRIFKAGIAAADPYLAVKRCLTAGDFHLEIVRDMNNPSRKRIGRWTRIHPIAFGKAACTMAQAVQEIIPGHLLATPGIAVTNYENVAAVPNFEVIGASHPLPDQSGLNAAHVIAERARLADRNELVLILVSGGGSALIPSPQPPVTLKEKITTTDLLLSCGATINQINCVRKHLSGLKGGGLARLTAPADLHALILSDVLGDDVSTIASGPTVPDATTFAEALRVLRTRGVWEQAPASVRERLTLGAQGKIRETPKPGDKIFDGTDFTLIGSNSISVTAIIKAAQNQGYQPELYSGHLCGEARDEAEKLAAYAKKRIEHGMERPLALLAGGETTVTLNGKGMGGRNQELALAFALAAEKQGLTGPWTFLSGGTDGRDGPTDAAGGIVDPGSTQRMRLAGTDPEAFLNDNNSYNALASSQDLLETGATGTNVADLQILLIHP
ncbi:MAG: glycerate kinase type-2 family protein [Gammaproteobacteria bacterium]